MSEEDVERFLFDLERELRHLGGERRRELVQEAEDRLHEVATQLAEHEGAERVEWYHYVDASARLGPPERLARELAGEQLPDRARSHRWMVAGAVGLVLLVAGLVGYAWWTTGDIVPIDEFSGQHEAYSGSEEHAFNVSEDADSVFLTLDIVPAEPSGTARVTVLDGANRLVYEAEAGYDDRLETSTFVDGEAGRWTVFVDFEGFTGSWSVKVQAER